MLSGGGPWQMDGVATHRSMGCNLACSHLELLLNIAMRLKVYVVCLCFTGACIS